MGNIAFQLAESVTPIGQFRCVFLSMLFEGTTKVCQLLSCRQICCTGILEVKSIVKRLPDEKSLTDAASSIYGNELRVFFMKRTLQYLFFLVSTYEHKILFLCFRRKDSDFRAKTSGKP